MATTVSRQEREDDEQRALTALEAIRLRGDCDSYRAERERLRPLLDVLSLPPELPCPPSGTQVSTTGVSQGTIVETVEISLIISGALDFGEVDIPAAGIGVSRAGPAGQAPEETAGETADTVRTIGFGLEGMFYIPGSDTLLQISGRYLAGDADRTFLAGGGTIDAGIVYGDLSPGGSSGIIGRTELTGDANVDVEEIRLRTELGLTAGGVYASRWYEDPDAGPPSSTSAKAAPGYSLGLYGEYIHSDRDYALSLSGFSTANPALQFSQERIQSISENYFGLGISGELRVPLGGALIARAGASGGGYYLTSSLSSFERNTNNFSAAVDRDFTIEIEDDDNGFGVMGEANAGLELMLAPSASVFVEGRVGYRSRVGAIFNPNSGDQVFVDGLTTELTTDNSWSYGAIIGLNFRL